MFLTLNHTNLEVYKQSYHLILEAYKITKHLPDSERFNLVSQIRRAALSVHLNIAEGSSRALDIIVGLEFISKVQLELLGEKIISTFKLLTGMIGK